MDIRIKPNSERVWISIVCAASFGWWAYKIIQEFLSGRIAPSETSTTTIVTMGVMGLMTLILAGVFVGQAIKGLGVKIIKEEVVTEA